MMRADYHSFLRDDMLTKVDRASMAVSLECRDPFLDHRFAEFAFSLPMEFHYANGEHKRLLKHVLRRWISEPILTAQAGVCDSAVRMDAWSVAAAGAGVSLAGACARRRCARRTSGGVRSGPVLSLRRARRGTAPAAPELPDVGGAVEQ